MASDIAYNHRLEIVGEVCQGAFWSKQKRILLEIKLPKEITKSPLAMETFLIGLHQTGREGTWYAKFWEGKTRTVVFSGDDFNRGSGPIFYLDRSGF